MCSKCHDRKVNFVDFLKTDFESNVDIKDVLFVCSRCKTGYKFNYLLPQKRRFILYNIIGITALLIAYFFGHKYLKFIDLILLQFNIHLKGILLLLVRLIEFFFWIIATYAVNVYMFIFVEWKLAKPTKVDCEER